MKKITLLLGCVFTSCSPDNLNTAENDVPLSVKKIAIEEAKLSPCVWSAREIEGLFFRDVSGETDIRSRKSRCFYTIYGDTSKNDLYENFTVIVNFQGYPQDKYDEFTKLYEQSPAKGFEVPVNLSSLHESGLRNAFVAYHSQGSFEVVVKPENETVARQLVHNIILRMD